MPEINDDENKRPDASSGTVYAQGTPQQEKEFTPWSRIQSANESVSEREAGKLKGQVQGDIDKATLDLSTAQGAFDQGFGANYGTKTNRKQPQAFAGLSGEAETPAAPAAFGGTSSATPFGAQPAAGDRKGRAPEAPVAYQQADTGGGAPPPLQPGAQPAPQGRSEGQNAPPPQTTASNPWASFLGPSPDLADPENAVTAPQLGDPGYNPFEHDDGHDTGAAPAAAPGRPDQPAAAPPPPGAHQETGARAMVQPQGFQQALRPFDLASGAVAGNPTGPHDLHEAAGNAWEGLLGDTRRASDEATALGSEGGVQALLQQNYGGESGAGGQMDAALIGGAGGKDFRDINKAYGDGQLGQSVIDAEKNSQSKWAQLQGDIASRKALSDQQARDNAAGARTATGRAPTEDAKPAEDTTDADLETLLFGEGNDAAQAFSTMHWGGMTLNPADWATIAMGEAGTDVEPTTELFSKMYDVTGGKIQDSWGEGKFLMAFNMLVDNGVGHKVSEQSRREFLKFLRNDPQMLQEYLHMKNPGYMARNMRQWMVSWDQAHGVDPMTEQNGADPYKRGQQADYAEQPDALHNQ